MNKAISPNTPKKRNLSFNLVVPCFNEGKVVRKNLTKLLTIGFKSIIFVDDGSNDDTYNQINDLPITILRNKRNYGQGYSIALGLKYSYLQGNSDYTITADADGQHTTDDIQRVIRATQKDRPLLTYAVRNFAHNVPLSKRISNTFARITVRLFFRISIPDPYCGLRAFSNEIIPKVSFRDRFEWNVDCAKLITKYKEKACQVNVIAHYSKYSLSKGLRLIEGGKLFVSLIKDEVKNIFLNRNEKNPNHYTQGISSGGRNRVSRIPCIEKSSVQAY